jgi:SAM-dependent methyltransferase
MVEDDLRTQLEKYGVYEDEWISLDELGHLDEEEKEVRKRIDAGLEREMQATEEEERSYDNYVKEATKTKINRLVALKTLEARGLVTETLVRRPEYGDRSYMHRTVSEVAGELCDAKDDGLGVALDLAFEELSQEIGVLFEEDEYTAVELDFKVREDVIELLNDLDEEVWEEDEAIGWVYQYFGENEREEIDERIDEENYKVQDTDIATKTQLFTPRYIVEWMVDNSLGRLWLEMQGEGTNIDDEDNCFYLAPLEESLIDREKKDVREIKVLDPACGSGHMLFYAFDVLYEMYLEEGKFTKSQIPNEILKNNLYGIDIDPGVVQLTALSLYVKAKSRAPDTEIEQINVVPADAVLVNGDKKKEVLDGLGELESRVVEEVWESFENIREYGSLVRIEEKIDEILEEWQEEGFEFAESQTRLSDSGGLEGQASLDSTDDDGWPTLKDKLLEKVSGLAEEVRRRGGKERASSGPVPV